jgi:hypothetical protein
VLPIKQHKKFWQILIKMATELGLFYAKTNDFLRFVEEINKKKN